MHDIQIVRAGSEPSINPPADYFTGDVRLERLADAKDPSRVAIVNVAFEPAARTNWHTHPVGQHLVITSGVGWVQQEGGDIVEVHPGDVVWFPPGVKHWHGATPHAAMSHLAIHEAQDDGSVTWLEPVSEEQYQK